MKKNFLNTNFALRLTSCAALLSTVAFAENEPLIAAGNEVSKETSTSALTKPQGIRREIAANNVGKGQAGRRTGKRQIEFDSIDALKKAVSDLAKKRPDENQIETYGLLQTRVNISDTQRQNVPDFQGQHARIGTRITGGAASGQLEVEFFGNQPYTPASNEGGTDPVSGQPQQPGAPFNDVVALRQAQLNLTLFSTKNKALLSSKETEDVEKDSSATSYATTVSLGGIRIGGAANVGPESINTPNGYSRMDGLYLTQDINCSKLKSKFGVGAFNSLFTASSSNPPYIWSYTYPSQQNFWLNNSISKNLAFVGTANVTYNFDEAKSLNVVVMHGFQNRAPYQTSTKSGALSQVRDVAHTEASVLYNDTLVFGNTGVLSSNGISAWYEREQNSRTMLAQQKGGNNFSYNQGLVDDAAVASLYGFGVAADSLNYLTNMIQKGDRLTYSIGYTFINNDQGNTKAQTFAPGKSAKYIDFNVSQVAGSFGYAINTFEAQFNIEYSESDKKIFTNNNGNANTHEIHTGFTAAYLF